MKKLLIGLFVLLVAALLIGAKSLDAETPVVVNVRLQEYKVAFSRQNVPAGVPVTFNFINEGTVVHEAVLEKAGAMDEPLELNGAELEVEDIQPGETKTVVWTLPEPTMYQIACHITGHFEGGMTKTFNARSGGTLVISLFEYGTYIAIGLVALAVIVIGYSFIARRQRAMKSV